jgi:hypothetical protein
MRNSVKNFYTKTPVTLGVFVVGVAGMSYKPTWYESQKSKDFIYKLLSKFSDGRLI